jgi:hypothetical protein
MNSAKNGTRTQLQIDVSPELRHELKLLAVQNKMTLRQFVLTTLANANPNIASRVNAELSGKTVSKGEDVPTDGQPI